MYMIGIAGGSGSGKTTFTQKIEARCHTLPGLVVLHQDSYYCPDPPAETIIDGKVNFDHPMAFDWPLLREHILALRKGKPIHTPIYDYTTSSRTGFEPCPIQGEVILFEGIFALWDENFRSAFDVRVFLHVDADIRFIRRLHRDVKDRGRSLDSIIDQYYSSVRPMYHHFLEPTRQFADIVVGEETDCAADVLAARVKEVLLANQTN